MAIEDIDLGTIPLDGTDGDTAREAFTKVNGNFDDLDTRVTALENEPEPGTVSSVNGILPNSSGNVSLTAADVGAATTAQGLLADSAVQPSSLGTAAYLDANDFATNEQGALADTAVQPVELEDYERVLIAGDGITIDRSNPDNPVISAEGGYTITAEQVKVLYESNPDTNVFNDSEKSKLSTVLPEATPNYLPMDQITAEQGASASLLSVSALRIRQAILGWWNTSTFKTKLDTLPSAPEVDGKTYGLKDRNWVESSGVANSTLVRVQKQYINPTGLVKFGNMTADGGLEAAFDGLTTTTARRETTTGYVGLTLTTPRSVNVFEVVGSHNGFDGSGLVSSITISVYGKNGAPPTSGSDGVLLGNTTFTESGQFQVIRINNSQPNTAYSHYWVSLVTPVWSVVSEFNLYVDVPFNSPVTGGNAVYLAACDRTFSMPTVGVEVPEFRIPIQLTSPRVINLDFHGDVVHTGVGADASVAVGFFFTICYRSGATAEAMRSATFTAIRNAVGGGNVSEVNPQHYGNKSICSSIELPSGFHELSIIVSGHTDGSSTQGLLKILVEYGQGINTFRATVLP